MPECYYPNGAIYIAAVRDFETFYSKQIIPFIMDEQSSVDVDTKKDLMIASEILYNKMTTV